MLVIKENRYIRAGYSWDWAGDASGKLKLCDNDSSASYRFQNNTYSYTVQTYAGRQAQAAEWDSTHTHTFRPERSSINLQLSLLFKKKQLISHAIILTNDAMN